MARKKLIATLLICSLLVISSAFVLAVPEFEAQEGEVLYLSAETFDIDGDDVIVYFPEPFDDNGRWITDYDDAGEYVLTIVATDTELNNVSYDIILTVEDVNQEPYLSEDSLTYDEGDEIDLSGILVDPDNDVLTYYFGEPFDSEGYWQTGFTDAGRYVVEIIMDDGEFSLIREAEVIIEDINAAPEITEIFLENGEKFELDEDELIDVYVEAFDIDEDEISYEWYIDDTLIATENSFDLNFDYDAGDDKYNLLLKISDSSDEGHEEWLSWTIAVNNVNRAPEVEDIILETSEGETVSLDLDLQDLDGDIISYNFDQFFDENGDFEVDYENAGEYEVIGTASDGELSTEFIVSVTIEDTDRAPAIYGSPSYSEIEGETMSFILEAEDLDGDEISFEVVSGLPSDAQFSEEGEFSWEIPFNAVERESNFISDILNSLRIEKWFTSKRDFEFIVNACGEIECSQASIELIVENVNRAPEITEVSSQTISETGEISLEVLAEDPDGDIIVYYFTEPLDKKGYWLTDYDDAGEYEVIVTASDGYLTDDETITITVEKTNREPEFVLAKDSYTVIEGEEIKFYVEANDLDSEDNLTITVEDSADNSWFGDGTYSWVPDYDTVESSKYGFFSNMIGKSKILTKWFGSESETFWIELSLTDGEATVVMPVSITVKNVNRAPEIVDLNPGFGESFEISSDGSIDFNVEAEDLDGDELSYVWKFSGWDFGKLEGPSSISRVFSSAGTKKVEVKVCDHRDCVRQEWTLEVTGNDLVVAETSTSSSSSSSDSSDTTVVYVDGDSTPTYGIYTVEDWTD